MKTLNHVKSITLLLAPLLLPFLLHAQGLRINRGASVVVAGEVKLVLQDAGIINQGSFSPGNSTVIFAGDAARTYASVGGSSSLSFHNVIIDLPAGKLQLENDVTISGVLALKSGLLELNRYNLDLGRTGIISGENETAYITGQNGGTVTATVMLNAPKNINPGNIGIALSSAANLGWTVITRGHLAQTNADGQSGIHRYYDVRPTHGRGANIDLRFFYLGPELGKNKEQELMVWSNTDGMSWTLAGAERNDLSGNSVLSSNLSASNRFTLGPGSNSMVKTNWNAALKMGVLQSIQTYPNPATEKITLAITSMKNMEGNILLQDDHGRILEKRPINYRAGMNTMEWNLGRYATGTYYLVFEGMGSLKVVKQ
ncbi:MAG: hypothetical protein WCF67_08860 [Chitinophagaceae bacterium]